MAVLSHSLASSFTPFLRASGVASSPLLSSVSCTRWCCQSALWPLGHSHSASKLPSSQLGHRYGGPLRTFWPPLQNLIVIRETTNCLDLSHSRRTSDLEGCLALQSTWYQTPEDWPSMKVLDFYARNWYLAVGGWESCLFGFVDGRELKMVRKEK